MTKTIHKKKKCKKAKWWSEEALEIAEKRREGKGKGERESYTQMNAEIQRIARQVKNAFRTMQIVENNRMRKTKDLFKEIGDTKGKLHASSVHSFSGVGLFVAPWTAARQAPMSITSSRSLLKLMSIKLMIPSNHLILCCPVLILPSIFSVIRVFINESVLRIR